MASKKVKEIAIHEQYGVFNLIYPRKHSKENYDFSGINDLRNILSKERARMLEVIKNKKPVSIYDLSKKLNREFKSVFEDVKLLKRFGLVSIVKEKTKNRIRHKPILVSDELTIHLKIQ